MKARFTIWLESVGHTDQTYAAAQYDADMRGEFVKLMIDGTETVVTNAYWTWLSRQTSEWTTLLGYGGGYRSWDAAMAEHSFHEFDEWLNKKYGGV